MIWEVWGYINRIERIKTTNAILSVDQGAFGAMTIGYIQELISDDE